MKCLSLWQPWATAIAVGWKHYETRSWARAYRGPVAIHAAKKGPLEEIKNKAISLLSFGGRHDALPFFPLGAIVAVADIVDIRPAMEVASELMMDPGGMELLWGDYSPGRFAWKLENVRQLREPFPWRATQGLFDLGPKISAHVASLAGAVTA